jgi:hypothetical protein
MSEPDHVRAHENGSLHREEILRSSSCGCFYCLKTFTPAEIVEWIDEVEGVAQTALCPMCGIDAVIGSASGFPITEDFLKRMSQHWF